MHHRKADILIAPRHQLLAAPLPKDKLGHTNYYQWRAKDYEDRTGKTAPAYYREYGDKYAHLFSEETYDKLSPEGKKWLENTREGLQRRMEKGLAAGEWDETDANKFRKKAEDSHSEAYLEAGIADLPDEDLWEIAKTLEVKDYSLGAGQEAVETFAGMVSKWLQPAGGEKEGNIPSGKNNR